MQLYAVGDTHYQKDHFFNTSTRIFSWRIELKDAAPGAHSLKKQYLAEPGYNKEAYFQLRLRTDTVRFEASLPDYIIHRIRGCAIPCLFYEERCIHQPQLARPEYPVQHLVQWGHRL